MKDNIIRYREMCAAEQHDMLQKGMNFRLNPEYSVLLMSQRSNAPYGDAVHPDGITIEYEGHDLPKSQQIRDPKTVDQPRFTRAGKPTENGKFADAVDQYKKDPSKCEIVRIYEKVFDGVWSEKGFFKLINYKIVNDGTRKVFRFILEEVEVSFEHKKVEITLGKERSRIIPSSVKKEVWARDGGKCVMCGSTDELHFDHDLPYSKGGTSITAANVRILCARHNLQKSAKIE